MDRSQCEAIVLREAPGLVRMLRLEDWRIRYEFAALPDDAACCTRDTPYLLATLTFDPGRHSTEAELLASVRHELVHLVLSPFDMYRHYAAAAEVEGSAEAKQGDSVWHYAVERTVLGVTRAWERIEQRGRPMAKPKSETKPKAEKPGVPPAPHTAKSAGGKGGKKDKVEG